MKDISISPQLNRFIRDYDCVEDKTGLSPAKVYKLVGANENFYLKVTDSRYKGTTYDVGREKEMLLWLKNKLTVPEVLYYEQYEDTSFLLISEIGGVACSEAYQLQKNPEKIVRMYVECIRSLQSIDIADCPFNNNIDNRLSELDYLLNNGLADVDCENWEEDTQFREPDELFDFLKENKPTEELVFSHGDICDSNVFVKNDRYYGLIDLGRSGKADRWYDIAFCVREIRKINHLKYLEMFFNELSITPDWKKIEYFILLDELF